MLRTRSKLARSTSPVAPTLRQPARRTNLSPKRAAGDPTLPGCEIGSGLNNWRTFPPVPDATTAISIAANTCNTPVRDLLVC